MESLSTAITILDGEIEKHQNEIKILKVKRQQLVRKVQNECKHDWKSYTDDRTGYSETYCTKCGKS